MAAPGCNLFTWRTWQKLLHAFSSNPEPPAGPTSSLAPTSTQCASYPRSCYASLADGASSCRYPLRWPRFRRACSSSCQAHRSPPAKLIFSRRTTWRAGASRVCASSASSRKRSRRSCRLSRPVARWPVTRERLHALREPRRVRSGRCVPHRRSAAVSWCGYCGTFAAHDRHGGLLTPALRRFARRRRCHPAGVRE